MISDERIQFCWYSDRPLSTISTVSFPYLKAIVCKCICIWGKNVFMTNVQGRSKNSSVMFSFKNSFKSLYLKIYPPKWFASRAINENNLNTLLQNKLPICDVWPTPACSYLKKQTLETNEASMEDLIDIHTPSFHELTFYCLINRFIFS